MKKRSCVNSTLSSITGETQRTGSVDGESGNEVYSRRTVMLLFTMHLTLKIGIGIVSKCSVKMGVYKGETTFFFE
jgi:hypothetical protein